MSRLSELRTGRWQGAPLSLTSPTSGFRLRGRNDGPAAAHPTIVIPATAGIHTGGRRWVPLSTGTTGGGGAPTGGGGRTHNRHSRDGGIPQRGAGDGFPSPPERRAAAAHPQSSFPRRRDSTEGGRRWVPLSTGTTAGGGRTHNRHSRDGGNPRQPNRHSRDGGRRAHPNRHSLRRRESSAAPNRYRGGRGLARRRTCDTMTSAGIDGRSTRRRPAAPTLVGSMQPAAQRTCQS